MPNSARRTALALVAALLLAAPAVAGGAERTIDRKSVSTATVHLELENLAGRVELVRAQGSALHVVATLHAEASAGKSAEEILRTLDVDFDESGDRLRVVARFPVETWRRFHYPSSGGESGSNTGWGWFDSSSSTFEYLGTKVTVSSRSSAKTPTLWADFRVEVPSGLRVKVRNAVGSIASDRIEGPQNLDTNSGDIAVREGAGALDLDTGSGNVRVADHDGDVNSDTGSGNIRLERVRADQIRADTGSGDVEMESVAGALDLDTGSGDISGRDLEIGGRLRADTGSGDIRLAGDFAAVSDLKVDTGSGDVVLTVTGAAPSIRLTVDTGSGDVTIDLEEARIRKWKGEIVAEIGAAEGTGLIDTGSGDVTVRRAP